MTLNRRVQIVLLLLTVASLMLVASGAAEWLLILLLVLLLLLLLWWLFGSKEEEEEDRGTSRPSPDYPPEQLFVQEEVVVRGPVAAVTRAVNAVNGSIILTRVDRIDFSELDEAVRGCLNDCAPTDFNSFVIDLYKLTGSERDVAVAIQAIHRLVGRGSDVRAEPNWLSGHPWDPIGSPWDPIGSPWDPIGSSLTESQNAPGSLFLEQWAFEQIGLRSNEDQSRGLGVRIGVMDTSPFALEGDTLTDQLLPWVAEPTPLTVDVRHYPTPALADKEINLSNHGLFAAGLVHALAPQADIQLIRVLNENNKGTLFTLNKAIFEFIKDNAPNQQPEGQLGAVINMSLGIRVPPDEAGYNLPVEVQSLRDMLQAAHCAQIVVIAAAGNESANKSLPEPANLPANWPEIIGVAGSNRRTGRACFSNQGDLAAPAGDGRPDEKNESQCVPGNDVCDNKDCDYSVVGPIIKTDENTGFLYWSGTSFAAPMVSGLAALVIEKGNGQLSPAVVRHIIECGVIRAEDKDGYMGKGIIHVANTMARFGECLAELGITLDVPTQQSVEEGAAYK